MDIYTKKILELASETPFSERLINPDVTITRRTPVCGSSITIDMILSNGKITQFGQKINACALGQASSAIVTKEILGRTKGDVEELSKAVQKMLSANGPPPRIPYKDYEALSPAKNYKNRHASIMLILDTIIAGFEKYDTG